MSFAALEVVTFAAELCLLVIVILLCVAAHVLYVNQLGFFLYPLLSLVGYVLVAIVIDLGLTLPGMYNSPRVPVCALLFIAAISGFFLNLLCSYLDLYLIIGIDTFTAKKASLSSIQTLQICVFTSAILFVLVDVWIVLLLSNRNRLPDLARDAADGEQLYLLLDEKRQNYNTLSPTPEKIFKSVPPLSDKITREAPAVRSRTSSVIAESPLCGKAEKDVTEAATQYNATYKRLMQLSTTVPSVHSNVKPFIGFSLTDNVKEGALVVDGVFDEGPAAQVGVKIDHEVLKIAGISVEGIAHARELVAEHCRPGHITRFDMRREDGTTFVASVWVMTADVKFKGKPYYFDVSLHRIRESDRLKRTWKEEDLQS